MFTLWNDLGDAGFGDLARTFASMEQFKQDMERALSGPAPRQRHTPRVHIHEEQSAFYLRFEVPGFKREDLELTVTGDLLNVRGKRAAQLPEGYTVHRRERSALAFEREFRLPRPVDSAKIEAALAHGVLTLTIPKLPEAQPKRIEVKTQ